MGSNMLAQPNAFYQELLDRGEVENAERYLRYLRGEFEQPGRKYTLDHFRVTELKRNIVKAIKEVDQENPPVLIEDIYRKVKLYTSGRVANSVIMASLENLLIYGYVDEQYEAYTLTEIGKAINTIDLGDRICKMPGVFDVNEVVRKLQIDRASTVRPTIRKLVKAGLVIRCSRGKYLVKKEAVTC